MQETSLTQTPVLALLGGTLAAWFAALGTGILGNRLVGMAAFFATMGRTIIGKFVPVLLAVTLFVAANFQHSPANAGYFAMIMPGGDGPGWALALSWNLVPATIGNILGAALLVALPPWFGLTRRYYYRSARFRPLRSFRRHHCR